MTFDVEKIRQDFPILHQEHSASVPLIYLDNGASSQKPLAVIETLERYYRQYNANVHRGIHKLSEEATSAYELSRDKVQGFINAQNRREIIFTRGTTESINLVAQTWGRANLKLGDVILSTVMEHHSNIVPWQMIAHETGATVKYIALNEDGTLDLDHYRELLANNDVKLVSVTHMSNVLGTINPIKEMAQMAHEAGAVIVVDGAQSVPHLPVNVIDLDVDFLAFSGHKMCAPTGIGILYGKEALLESIPPWMGGGDMIETVTLEGSTWNDLPYKFEAGTPNIADAVGLGAAVDYLSAVGMDQIHAHEQAMIEYALDRLEEVPGLTVYGPSAAQKGGVAAFTLNGIHAHDIAQILDADGIAVRAGHHCAMPLHQHLNVSATTRATFYLYNSTVEVDRLIASIYNAKTLFGV